MMAAHNTAFQAGTGFTPAALLTGIASVVLVLSFIWVIRVLLCTFRAWQNRQVVLIDVVWSTLHASIVLLVLDVYLITPAVECKLKWLLFGSSDIRLKGCFGR